MMKGMRCSGGGARSGCGQKTVRKHSRRAFVLRGLLPAAVLALALSGRPGAAPAQEAAQAESIGIELNRLQKIKDACRLSFVFTNKLPFEVAALSIETVLFNDAGQVDRLLALKSRPLTPGKIRVQQFDLSGTACDGIGRLLVNDVTDCKAGELTPSQCLERIQPSSRADVPFVSID